VRPWNRRYYAAVLSAGRARAYGGEKVMWTQIQASFDPNGHVADPTNAPNVGRRFPRSRTSCAGTSEVRQKARALGLVEYPRQARRLGPAIQSPVRPGPIPGWRRGPAGEDPLGWEDAHYVLRGHGGVENVGSQFLSLRQPCSVKGFSSEWLRRRCRVTAGFCGQGCGLRRPVEPRRTWLIPPWLACWPPNPRPS
jgi:hypothetical protein